MTTTHEPQLPTQGTIGKIKRLQQDGQHSVAELREFVAQMRGRSSQEMLGMVSASALVRATVQATLGIALVIAIFTVIPYFLAKQKPVAAKPVATTEANQAQPETPVAETTSTEKAGTSSPTATLEPDAAKAAKALNIDEAKPADPNINPLDKDLDKLLDGK